MNTLKIKSVVAIALILSISGCSMLGASIRELKSQKVKYQKTFDKEISYCYKTALDTLNKWKADICNKKANRLIVAVCLDRVFNNCINTTEVAVFFKELEPNKTEVEVSSLDYELSRFVAEKLFGYLENPDLPPLPVSEKPPSKSY